MYFSFQKQELVYKISHLLKNFKPLPPPLFPHRIPVVVHQHVNPAPVPENRRYVFLYSQIKNIWIYAANG